MKALVLKLILSSILCSYAADAAAQVRVRRWRDIMKSKNEKKLIPVPERSTRDPENIVTEILPSHPSEMRAELDARFYVPWNSKRTLYYDDFLHNRNLYNKFLPAKDTDLTKVIYPDYRDFYRKLTERVTAAGGMDDKFWQERVERVLRGRSDSIDAGYISVIDADLSFSISIDSPAASVIAISPVIYAVNETTYYYNITALFNRNESWMIVKSKDILQHEQIHFDIFELYARRMRKHLAETLKQNYADGQAADIIDEINPAFERLYQQLNDMQLEFDRETVALTSSNAPLAGINAKWKKQLHTQIESLSAYAIAEGNIILTATPQ